MVWVVPMTRQKMVASIALRKDVEMILSMLESPVMMGISSMETVALAFARLKFAGTAFLMQDKNAMIQMLSVEMVAAKTALKKNVEMEL